VQGELFDPELTCSYGGRRHPTTPDSAISEPLALANWRRRRKQNRGINFKRHRPGCVPKDCRRERAKGKKGDYVAPGECGRLQRLRASGTDKSLGPSASTHHKPFARPPELDTQLRSEFVEEARHSNLKLDHTHDEPTIHSLRQVNGIKSPSRIEGVI
jgi:hypothetical protein